MIANVCLSVNHVCFLTYKLMCRWPLLYRHNADIPVGSSSWIDVLDDDDNVDDGCMLIDAG